VVVNDRPAATPPFAQAFEDNLPRIEWLAQQALVAQAEAQRVACRLADLGCVAPLAAPRGSRQPHLADLREQLLALEDRADRAWAEVERLGGRIADRAVGFVDVLATVGEREVMLCWQLGEKAVSYWHAPDEPCRERRLLETTPYG
jgi:hypothetical protein